MIHKYYTSVNYRMETQIANRIKRAARQVVAWKKLALVAGRILVVGVLSFLAATRRGIFASGEKTGRQKTTALAH